MGTPLTPESLVKEYCDYKLSQCFSSRSMSNRASSIGNPCIAYLAFERVAGEKKELPDATLASIFAEGRLQEHGVISDLRAMGYEIHEAQRSMYWDRFNISAHIDGMLAKNGMKPVLIEIKSCSPFAFAKFNTVEDILASKKHYYRSWPCQLMIYMLLEEVEESYLILKSKTSGMIKVILVPLDLPLAESLLQKAEEVNRGVAQYASDSEWRDHWLKDHRVKDIEQCLDCPFKSLCAPDIDAGAGIYFSSDGEMAESLKRWEETENASDEHAELDKDIKGKAKRVFEQGSREILCGDFIIKGNKVEPKGKTPYFRIDIERIGKPAEVA